MAGPTRQHYALATGGALAAADGSKKVLKYAKGGAVKANFKKGANVSGRKGDDKFTTVTHKGSAVPKGFKVHRP